MALTLEEPPARQRADLGSTEALEQRHAPIEMRITGGLGAHEDQLGRVLGMAGGIGQRYRASERRTVDDRPCDAERLAERVDIVGPLRQVPALARTRIAAAVAAMIEEHDLGHIGQGRERGLVDRMIDAWAAVEEEKRRLLTHRGPVGHKASALDVEEQAHAVDRDVHP